MDDSHWPMLLWDMRLGLAVLILCLPLLLSGCGNGDDNSPAQAPTTSNSSRAETSPSTTGPARIPETFGPPEELAAGTYLTPEGFAPEMSVQVPAGGWWGGGSSEGWFLGQGNDPALEAFTGPSLWVDVVPMRWRDAVAAFRHVKGAQYEGAPKPSTLEGHRAMTFRAKPRGREPVLLEDALGVGVDLPPASDRQLLIDAGKVTLLVRIENDGPAIDEILATMAFT